jgi:BirA family transcriptional regulator, biotin operon repressor / biotin---[acetyl-CoA-carboxylase] ligase
MNTADKLLLFLKTHTEQWISGEVISQRLQISRTAVSKHVQNLKQKGYTIESATKKGYYFKQVSHLLLPEEIRYRLATENLGQKEISYFTETDSTNTQATLLAMRGAAEGTLVIAESQTKGKGRKGRSWLSPSVQGIYCSLILRAPFSPNQAPLITLLAAVAITETLLEVTGLPVQIKWPNDILLNGKKIAGILTEMSTEVDRIDYIIVGLGLNVATSSAAIPAEFRSKATSLLLSTGKIFSRVLLVQKYLQWFEHYYYDACQQGFEKIRTRWKELSAITGMYIKVEAFNHVYAGYVIDIDTDGSLLLRNGSGDTEKVLSGDIIHAVRRNTGKNIQ